MRKSKQTTELKTELLETNPEVIQMTKQQEPKLETKATDALESLAKEKSKQELSKDEKKRLRREAMEVRGRLTLPDEYKEAGYRYRVCNVIPGNIENWKSRGYEVVTHNMKSGSGNINTPEVSGNPFEIEVGGGGSGSMKAIWMRTTEDNGQILDEIRDDAARAQADMIYKNPGIPDENLIGKVSKEQLK